MKKTESRLEEASRSADIAGGRNAFSLPSSPSTSREGGESSGRPATEKSSGQHAVAEAATSEGVTGADSKPGEVEVGAVGASPSTTVDDRQQQQRRRQRERQRQPGFARVVVTCEMLRSVLGPEIYESEVAARVAVPGMCTGLAWTPTGGELLFIECTSMPGSGNVKLTGKLGAVRSSPYPPELYCAYAEFKTKARPLYCHHRGCLLLSDCSRLGRLGFGEYWVGVG